MPSKKLPSGILKVIPKEEQEQQTQLYVNSTAFAELLSTVIKDMIASTDAKSIANERYFDTPNWAEFQADSIGYKRALTEVLRLLPTEE